MALQAKVPESEDLRLSYAPTWWEGRTSSPDLLTRLSAPTLSSSLPNEYANEWRDFNINLAVSIMSIPCWE